MAVCVVGTYINHNLRCEIFYNRLFNVQMVDAQRVYLIINFGLFSIIDIASQFLIRLFNILVRTDIRTYMYKYMWSELCFNYTSIDEKMKRCAFLE